MDINQIQNYLGMRVQVCRKIRGSYSEDGEASSYFRGMEKAFEEIMEFLDKEGPENGVESRED